MLNENFEVNPEAFVENNQSENAQLCNYETFQSEVDQNEAIITNYNFSDNFDSDPLILEAELFAADHDVAVMKSWKFHPMIRTAVKLTRKCYKLSKVQNTHL